MFSYALLIRCLLIVVLCYDLSVSQWTASAMAATEAQLASDPQRKDAGQDDKDCLDSPAQNGKSASHNDCDCGLGAACCAFPISAITHAILFATQPLSDQPMPRGTPLVPLRGSARVFRPPIG